jgi:hypothetical protein
MRRTVTGMLVLVSCLAMAESARAQVVIQVPYVRVSVGQPGCLDGAGVRVQAPFVNLHFPRAAAASVVVPAAASVPLAAEPGLALVQPVTHQQFAESFKAAPGTYEVLFVHSRTGAPVKTTFTLPPGSANIRVERHALRFDYGRHHDVEVRFALGGNVRVRYHD